LKIALKNITVWFLLSLFLTPIAVKISHTHEHHFICTAKTEKHFHNYETKCNICDFTISLFNSKSEQNNLEINYCIDFYVNALHTVYYLKQFFNNNLLRAPPVNN